MKAGSLPTVEFPTRRAWRDWLADHGGASDGVWLRLYKMKSGVPSVTHDEALNEAIAFGWIDGQLKPENEKSWLRKFTPRRPNSLWSKKNIERAERLIESGKMQSAGQQEVDRAKADGRWSKAYDAPSDSKVPEDFIEAVIKNPAAKATFESLNRANLYAIAWRLQTAKKPETRQKRFEAMLKMLEEGRRFH